MSTREEDLRKQYGGSAYDQQYFTDDQLKQAADIRTAAQNGQTDWGSAHNFVEGIRNQYGYSGGNDGSKYLANPQFNYSPAPTYKSKYQDKIDSIVNQINGLNYDTWKQGGQYKALQDSYTRNGSKAMEDTLAQISARTGGLASSYAGTAAQQSYNDFLARLEDAAMNMYERDRVNLYDQANLYRGLESDLYGRYADQLGQWNTDRNFTYNMGRDAIGDQRYNQEYADSRADTEYNRKKADENTEYERQRYMAEVLAAKGDYSGYESMGFTDKQISAMKAYDAEQKALAMSSRSSGGRSGSSVQKAAMSLTNAKAMAEEGLFTPEVLQAFYTAGYTDDYLASAYGYDGGGSESDNESTGYQSLGKQAKSLLSTIQRSAYRNGNSGITGTEKKNLEAARKDGRISDAELNTILDILGY